MRKGLCLLIWLMFFIITGCGDANINVNGDANINVNTDPDDGNSKDQDETQNTKKTVGSVAVTGQIMLGPIIPGNNLKAEALDKENNSLGTSAVSSYGNYNIKLKDHNGPFIIRVYSNNPNQCSSSGDYVDEAMGAPKCFGNRYLLSTSFVNTGEATSSVNLEVHSSPATTMAAFHAGIDINENGGLSIPNNLSKEIIAESNIAVAQVLGLGDKPITDIKPTSLITSDKKFKQSDAYASALAMISGVEAVNNGQSPNDLLRQISKGITTDNNSPQLNPAIQDMLVKGLHKVADKIKEKSTDTSILEAIIVDINNVQDNFPDSLYTVDLTKDLPKPQFTNSNKTSNLKPVWQWHSGDLGAGTFKYKFDNQTQWTVTTSNTLTPKSSLKLGIYKLEVREMAQTGEWGLASESVIEIVANNKGTVSIDGEPKQGDNLTAKPNDLDGITSAINYSWFSDDQLITNINNSQYLLSESDVGKRIKVVIDYTDALGAQETAMAETAIILTNTESVVEITIPDPDNNSPPQAVSYTHTVETKVEALVELLATDSENNSLIFFIKSLPKNGILKDGSKEITVLPYTLKNNLTYTSTSEIGIEDSFMFVANDGVVDSSAAVIGININHPPQMANQPSTSVYFGDSYSFEPKVTDSNNDKALTFNYDNIPSWLEFDSANGGLVGTPQEGDLGLHENIYFTVTDSTGLRDRFGPFNIQVLNSPPQARSELQTVIKNTASSVELRATDPENNNLNYIITILPRNGVLKDGGKEIEFTQLPHTLKNNLTYTSNSDIAIEDSFKFVANDGAVDSSAAVISININHPPQMVNQPSTSVYFGDSYSFEPKVTDSNNDKALTFNYDNIPSWLEFDSANGGLVGTPKEGDVGLHENIYFTVTDSTGLRDRFGPFNIQVLNSPPQAESYTQTVGTKVEALVELLATDSENNSLIFFIISLPQNGILKDGGKEITLLPYTPKNNLTYTSNSDIAIEDSFKFVANDGVVDSSAAVISININHPPQMVNQPSTSVDFGDSYSFEPKVTDSNNDKALTFNYDNIPSWLEFDSANGLLFGTPQEGDVGLHENIFLTVTDSTGLSDRIGPFNIQVLNENLFIKNTQTTAFPVCWGEKIDEISDEDFRTFKNSVKQLLIESWSKYAMVDFIGWDDCITDLKEITKILFVSRGPSYYSELYNKIVFNADAVNYLKQYTIVHEFGHLLGFSHEQDRLDTFRYGGLGLENNWYNNYCDSIEPGGPRVTEGFPEEYLAELENDYDPYSIMNYCSVRLRYSSSSAFKGKLSLLDIDKVRKKYGTRSDTILTIKGKPMTGFYNDGSGEYEYYEHGVIATLGRDTVFPLPKQPIVGSYKNISHKNGMNSLVDLSRQKTYQSGIYIPLADHLISICSYSQNSISSDTLTSFENCKNFDENDYVGYRSYYFNSRENTYNQVMKSFCQELRGDQTPWDSEQFFVSLTNCVELADYFIDSSGKRLYFNGIGYTGRIKELEHKYFIDGVLYEDEYKFDSNILTKKPFRDELPAYKQVNDNIQMSANFYGIYDGFYYLNGVQADDYEFVSEWDSDNFEITNIFSLISGKLYKNRIPYVGYNPSKLQNHNGYYLSGDYVPEENYTKVGQDIYLLAENKLGSNYSDLLYKNGVELTGFNSSTLGNGINSYYVQGFPTTILCENNSSSSCSDKNDSVEEIYQKFKEINSYYIFAWINVATQYSRYGENLDWENTNLEPVAPILFKGHNPHTGLFDGRNYRAGYPE